MIEYRVDILFGEKKLEPVAYTLKKLPNGQGVLESEFCRLTGDYCDLLVNSKLLGGQVKIVA